MNPICIKPYEGGFIESVEFSLNSTEIVLYPAIISANLGDDQACGFLGKSSNTICNTYTAYWTITGSASYNDVPAISV